MEELEKHEQEMGGEDTSHEVADDPTLQRERLVDHKKLSANRGTRRSKWSYKWPTKKHEEVLKQGQKKLENLIS